MSPTPIALDKEDLRRTIATVIEAEVDQVQDGTMFVDDLGVDSLMALEVVVVLEKRYRVKLHEEDLRQVTCLRNAYTLLRQKLDGR